MTKVKSQIGSASCTSKLYLTIYKYRSTIYIYIYTCKMFTGLLYLYICCILTYFMHTLHIYKCATQFLCIIYAYYTFSTHIKYVGPKFSLFSKQSTLDINYQQCHQYLMHNIIYVSRPLPVAPKCIVYMTIYNS